MKKKLSVLLILVFAMAFVFTACKDNGNSGDEVKSLDDGKFRIALLINGDLGDMSFWDSANAGMLKFKKDHPETDVNIVVMGSSDPTVYESTLAKTANEAYDLIIVGTTDMREPLQRLVKKEKYADRRFVIFDTEIKDGKAADYPTVHSVMFKQNEGGFLAGVIAALLSQQNSKTNTAFIGGAANDIINDFGCGFMQGVQLVNSEKTLNMGAYNAFIGDFIDSPRGKSLAQTYYDKDVSVMFAAASQAGIGCIEAAKLSGNKIIGVDSDQYDYYKDTDSEKASAIVTSILKQVGNTLYEICEAFMDGTLTYGDLSVLGVADGKIDYVDNDNYKANLSVENRAYVSAIKQKIISGELVIKSGLKRNMPTTELRELFDTLDPTK